MLYDSPNSYRSAQAEATDMAGPPVVNETAVGPPVPHVLGAGAMPVVQSEDRYKTGFGPRASHKPRANAVPAVQPRFPSIPVD